MPLDKPRRSRWSVAFAAGLLAASVLMIVFSLASLVLPDGGAMPNRPSVADAVAVMMVLVTFPIVGAVVAALRPASVIGWLFLSIGLLMTASIFASEYTARDVFTAAALPAAPIVAWVGEWSWIAAVGLGLTVTLLLFPDGGLPGPRWRPVLWLSSATIALAVFASAFRPGYLPGYDNRVPNPFGAQGLAGEPLATVVAGFVFPAIAILAALSLAGLLRRFSRSRGIERQQIKWFLFAGALMLVAFVTASVTGVTVAWYVALFGFAAMPIAAGIAVLRYRLYDIDVVIRRTLVYTVVTGVLASVYVSAVVVLQAVLAPVIPGGTIPVALSTLLAAALFQPVRLAAQAAVDRQFYRSRYDAAQTANAFRERLRAETDIGAVTNDLAGTVNRTIHPTSVSVWVRRERTERKA